MAPTDAGRAHLKRLAPRIGIRDPARELRPGGAGEPAGPGSVVRYQQVRQGIPVFAGELVARLDGGGRLLSLAGELLGPGEVKTAPRLPAAESEAIATAELAGRAGVPEAALDASRPELRIYDPRLIGAEDTRGAQLVWLVEVASDSRPELGEEVLVDASTGEIANSFPTHPAALERRICNARHTAMTSCEPPYDRAEGDPPTGVADVDEAYENIGHAYDYYLDRHGRDSYDDRGSPVSAIVRQCPAPQLCPDRNAGWNKGTITFGDGFTVLDITGHELTHGVTDHTSHLIYGLQSGAINESMSDVFGVLIEDYVDPGSNPDWLIAEGLPGGIERDMSDPPRFDDPDRMRSPLYDGVENEVHINSGVGNKAAYLIAEGGSFRGHSVHGLGTEKTAAIYYEAQVALLTSGSAYFDLAFALRQGCRNLLGGPEGIVAADCAEIGKVIAATQMRRQPRESAIRRPRACPKPGDRPDPVLFDDFEDPSRGLWKAGRSGGGEGWSYPPPRRGQNATSGRLNLWGPIRPGRGSRGRQASIRMRRAVRIPRGGWLHFRHELSALQLEPRPIRAGGVLEYRVGGNPRWRDAGKLFDAGGYTGRLTPGIGNPLARGEARRAFVRDSKGYGASRVKLAPLAGKRVRFRFRSGAGPDRAILADWYIDDLQIHRCVPK